MDYQKFLNRKDTQVLPYLGGASVDAINRRLRITQQVEPGWWQFTVEGRYAKPEHKTNAPDISNLAKVRGHLVGNWLFSSGNKIERLYLLPQEEPPIFSIATARSWHNGSLLFDCLEFEGDGEESARLAFEQNQSISDIKGIDSSLRAAFGFAVLSRIANHRNIQISPWEAILNLAKIASDIDEFPNNLLDNIEQQREQERQQQSNRRTHSTTAHRASHGEQRNLPERISSALDQTGAILSNVRSLSTDEVEVVFYFMGERFISIVDCKTLQVLDAGICLEGEDKQLNLNSLPGVIREAIDTGQLYITRMS